MVRTHTISAPDDIWQEVFDQAEQKQTTISDITRQAWFLFFNQPKEKQCRKVDFVILILLLAIFSALLSLLGVLFL